MTSSKHLSLSLFLSCLCLLLLSLPSGVGANHIEMFRSNSICQKRYVSCDKEGYSYYLKEIMFNSTNGFTKQNCQKWSNVFFEEMKNTKCPIQPSQESCKPYGQYFFDTLIEQCPKCFKEECPFTTVDESALQIKLADTQQSLNSAKAAALSAQMQSKAFEKKYLELQPLEEQLKMCKVGAASCKTGDEDGAIKELQELIKSQSLEIETLKKSAVDAQLKNENATLELKISLNKQKQMKLDNDKQNKVIYDLREKSQARFEKYLQEVEKQKEASTQHVELYRDQVKSDQKMFTQQIDLLLVQQKDCEARYQNLTSQYYGIRTDYYQCLDQADKCKGITVPDTVTPGQDKCLKEKLELSISKEYSKTCGQDKKVLSTNLLVELQINEKCWNRLTQKCGPQSRTQPTVLSSEAEDDVPPALKPYSWSNVTVILVVFYIILSNFAAICSFYKYRQLVKINQQLEKLSKENEDKQLSDIPYGLAIAYERDSAVTAYPDPQNRQSAYASDPQNKQAQMPGPDMFYPQVKDPQDNKVNQSPGMFSVNILDTDADSGTKK